MTDEDYNNIGAEMVALFGDKLPDPYSQPMQFRYYVQLLKYERFLNEQRNHEAASKQPNPPEGNVCEETVENSEGTEVPATEVPDAS